MVRSLVVRPWGSNSSLSWMLAKMHIPGSPHRVPASVATGRNRVCMFKHTESDTHSQWTTLGSKWLWITVLAHSWLCNLARDVFCSECHEISPPRSEAWCTQRKGSGGKRSQHRVTTGKKKRWQPGKGAGRLSTGTQAVCLSPVPIMEWDNLSAWPIGPVATLPHSEAYFRFKGMFPLIWQRADNNGGSTLCCKCVIVTVRSFFLFVLEVNNTGTLLQI